MRFLVVTFAPTLKIKDEYFSYGPYVDEINIWTKFVDEIGVISPTLYKKELLLSSYKKELNIYSIPSFSITSFKNILKSLVVIPIILFKIFKAMYWADHIHLRCPGNVGLLGALVQILFPNKPKTVKYAGNWDPNSKQPLSYRFQKWLLSNTFLTTNCKVLVYGEWKNQSKNIVPFFTATYSKDEIVALPIKKMSDKIIFIFVGTLSKGKQPLLAIKTINNLKEKGYDVHLDMYGDGEERKKIEQYILLNNLSSSITLHGNAKKEIIKQAYQKAHFLVFISKSEGWPKVVAEAMFWSCLPITTDVSCVPFMVANGKRGALVKPNIEEIVNQIEIYLKDEKLYQNQVEDAKNWSQEFTLEKFEFEIKNILLSGREQPKPLN